MASSSCRRTYKSKWQEIFSKDQNLSPKILHQILKKKTKSNEKYFLIHLYFLRIMKKSLRNRSPWIRSDRHEITFWKNVNWRMSILQLCWYFSMHSGIKSPWFQKLWRFTPLFRNPELVITPKISTNLPESEFNIRKFQSIISREYIPFHPLK